MCFVDNLITGAAFVVEDDEDDDDEEAGEEAGREDSVAEEEEIEPLSSRVGRWKVNDWVAVEWQKEWYPAQIISVNRGNIRVSCLEATVKQLVFKFPKGLDKLTVSAASILDTLVVKPLSSGMFELPSFVYDKIEEIMSQRN